MAGCFVSLRGLPLPLDVFCFKPAGLEFWVELLELGLSGGLADDIFEDFVVGLTDDLENVGEEKSPCLAGIYDKPLNNTVNYNMVSNFKFKK